MKKNTLLLLLLVCMALIAGILMITRKSGTIKEELRDFTVKDTASVTKLFLADKSGSQVLLERQSDGTWLMNGKEEARPDGVRMLLSTLHDIEVRSPVAKAAYNNIIRNIAGHGIKTEVYNAEGLIKTIYVGGPTQDQYGTFMYLENSSAPFIVHIPGFEGYLTPRFIVNVDDWRVRKVLHLSPKNLKKLTVTDRDQPGRSYSIIRTPDDIYEMRDEKDQPVAGVSRDKIISYLEYFAWLNYEFLEQTLSSSQTDSLRKSQPFRTLISEQTDGKTVRVDLWRRPQTPSTVHKLDPSGVPYPYDIDRMNATLNGDSTLLVVQYFSFEKLFRKTGDFVVPGP